MPWTVDDPPPPARNWTRAERERCVTAANAVLDEGGTDEEAIFACIRAAGKGATTVHTKYTKQVRVPITFEYKEDGSDTGRFKAVFSTFNVIDHDQDVTLPGAFKVAQEVRIAQWGHNWMALPAGKGVIGADEKEAWVNGEFFLDTTHGQDTYRTVKGLGGLQEWSYGFEIVQSEFGQHDGQDVRFLKALDVIEVSPVMLGAGINTRTDAIKGAQPYAAHADAVLATVKELVGRSRSLADLRAKEGRVLSDANRRRLAELRQTLGTIADELDTLLADTDPERDDGKGQRLYLEFQKLNTHLIGVGLTGVH